MAETTNKLELQIVTPARRVLAEEVDEVIMPSVEGYFGVRPGHAPLLARLGVGQISCNQGKDVKLMAISGGFAEVLREGVTVLAVTCEPADEIDVDRAKEARQRAEERLKSHAEDVDFRRAEAALARALNRIHTSGRSHGL
jgi:F-type H+-transporting ATPase subunit epsilon